ncbi:peptidase M, neutral zinc metallopeptidase site [Rivularia sp. UHCC 0363]|uniref:tetratricopeptide repeat protein n=1 Tax=Rivularia sp. UHCC 0363 TaxID=3110244 RepID=UPI002B200112|nr:peptidase M, neutral zinc metallopeptidase site [Rivularia sp. UHCC 0363]MEA5592827.1 peptidase M, neutral zinc metallopeptidase site [Rivularia sp. UHCC 0363]
MAFLTSFKDLNQALKQVEAAEKLAKNKQLQQAIAIAQKLIATWYEQPSFHQLLLRKLFLEKDLDKLEQQLKKWRKQLAQADKLIAHAKILLEQDTGNPLETNHLSNAIAQYERCSKIICDATVSQAIDKYQQELAIRGQFKKIIVEAELQTENRFFQNAIATYRQAQQLYITEALTNAIATCETHIKQEQAYSRTLESVNQARNAGKLKTAIGLLSSALTTFPRSDGIELLKQLQTTLQSREKFRSGLKAEKSGDFKQAETLYQAALMLCDSTECKIRLVIVLIKSQDWVAALNYLENLQIEQAAYLRGFVRAKQGNFQAAEREWQALPGERIQAQREILLSYSRQQKLLNLQNIEQLVKQKNLESAKTASIEFIEKFGSNSVVETNLNEHIQPSIAASLWQGCDWGMIADIEKAWIEAPNITNLHNWMVAVYYRARNETPIQIESVKHLIVALSTALANLHNDTSLKDLPWMLEAVDLETVSRELKQRLSDMIDSFKDQNINEYLELRDRYRLETVALNLMGNPPSWGMKVKQLLITPGCHSRYLDSWRNILVDGIDKQEILRSLYTPWGLAVAACVEGDIQRAIQLKPSNQAVLGETFAREFVAYHEGCEQLKRKWQSAIVPLSEAKTAIKANRQWEQEIDKLCGLQRQEISELAEHLEFAQFWYGLLGSQAAKSYLVEYKAQEIREKLTNQQISSQQALKLLKEIKKNDLKNPVVIDLIERIEYSQEVAEIERLFNNQRYDEAVKKAKCSQQQVKFSVANFLIEHLINSVDRELADYQIIQQLGRWAYEICPDEPAFQEVYRSLKIGY